VSAPSPRPRAERILRTLSPDTLAALGILPFWTPREQARHLADIALERCERPLLSTGNPKLLKARLEGWDARALHLLPHVARSVRAPDTRPPWNLCPNASAGCARACLESAGRGGFLPVRVGRLRRTLAWILHPGPFVERLRADIGTLSRSAKRSGLRPAVRLNATSDIPWESRAPSVLATCEREGVQAFDYSKAPGRVLASLRDPQWPRSYALTYSLSEERNSLAYARTVLEAGGTATVVLRVRQGEPLPPTWDGRPVLDGDLSDLRFRDPSGTWIGLRPKGAARSDRSGFVREPDGGAAC